MKTSYLFTHFLSRWLKSLDNFHHVAFFSIHLFSLLHVFSSVLLWIVITFYGCRGQGSHLPCCFFCIISTCVELCVVWLLHYVSKCFTCVLSRDHFPGLMACLWGAWNTGARQSRSVSSRRTTVSSKLIRQTFATCASNSKLKSLRPINCHMKCPLFSERNISSLSYFWNNSFRSSSCPTDLNCFHYIQSWDTHCTDHLIPFAQWCWERCVGR